MQSKDYETIWPKEFNLKIQIPFLTFCSDAWAKTMTPQCEEVVDTSASATIWLFEVNQILDIVEAKVNYIIIKGLGEESKSRHFSRDTRFYTLLKKQEIEDLIKETLREAILNNKESYASLFLQTSPIVRKLAKEMYDNDK